MVCFSNCSAVTALKGRSSSSDSIFQSSYSHQQRHQETRSGDLSPYMMIGIFSDESCFDASL